MVSIDRSVLNCKELEKLVHSTFCESPLKISRHLIQLLAIRILIPNSANSSVYGLFSTGQKYTRFSYPYGALNLLCAMRWY